MASLFARILPSVSPRPSEMQMAARVQFLVVVALLTIGCGISEAPSTSPIEGSALTASGRPVATVEAEGGRASLALPLGALPAGVSEKDVAVTVSFVTVPAIQPGEMRGLAIVELSPDGVQLTAPATLTLTFPPGARTGVPLVVHLSGDQATLITDVALELDANSGQMRLSVPVQHFSKVFLYGSTDQGEDLFNRSATVAATHYLVGDTFDVSLKVARFGGSIALFYGGPLNLPRAFILNAGEPLPDPGKTTIWKWEAAEEPWELEGKVTANGDLAPAQANDLPSKTRIGASNSYTGSTRLTCVRPGGGLFHYETTITFKMAEHLTLADGRVLDGGQKTKTTRYGKIGIISCDAPRINAALAAPFTTYTIIPGISTGLSSVHYAWSGANCGSVTGSTTAQLVWNHGEDNCDHSSVNHDEATISLLISGVVTTTGDKVEVRCRYQSAVSGRGSPCVQEPGGRQ